MLRSKVEAIAIAPHAQRPLRNVSEVLAIAGCGLEGDRYGEVRGTYQKGVMGKRQVTLFDAKHLDNTGYTLAMTRRNIAVRGDIDLMRLITVEGGVEFQIGDALCRGYKYCDPCGVPSKLAGKKILFRDQFWGRGGLIIEVVESGIIWVGCDMIVESLKMY